MESELMRRLNVLCQRLKNLQRRINRMDELLVNNS